MSLLAAAILAVIWPWAFPVGGPGAMIPESTESYETRLGTIARAAASVGGPAESSAVVTLWRAESRFRLDVHAGTRKGDHGRATCLGSVHPWAPDWALLAGVDQASTDRCAARTAQALRSGLYLCGKGRADAWAYAYEYYAIGHCGEPGQESRARAHSQAALESRLWAKINLDRIH